MIHAGWGWLKHIDCLADGEHFAVIPGSSESYSVVTEVSAVTAMCPLTLSAAPCWI
jgi:hypothetical protein